MKMIRKKVTRYRTAPSSTPGSRTVARGGAQAHYCERLPVVGTGKPAGHPGQCRRPLWLSILKVRLRVPHNRLRADNLAQKLAMLKRRRNSMAVRPRRKVPLRSAGFQGSGRWKLDEGL